MYIRFIVPVLGVFYGTSLIADEVDDKTITYLFTRPIPRGAVLLGKYLAYLVCTDLLIVLPSVMVVYFLIVPVRGGSIGARLSVAAGGPGDAWRSGWPATARCSPSVGARLKRPLVIGLVFAFGWEPAVLLFPGYLKRLTVAYYLQALVPHAMPNDGAISVLLQDSGLPGVAVSLVSAGGYCRAGAVARRPGGESREYVLEQ